MFVHLLSKNNFLLPTGGHENGHPVELDPITVDLTDEHVIVKIKVCTVFFYVIGDKRADGAPDGY